MTEAGRPTTFERITADPVRKKKFEEGYREFLLSELHIALEHGDFPSVSELTAALTEESGRFQPATRTSSDDISLKNFLDAVNLMGCRIFLKKVA